MKRWTRLLPLLLALMVLVPTSGCNRLFPGRSGWKCKSDKDCNPGLRCKRYRWRNAGYETQVCSDGARTIDGAIGWTQLIITWIVLGLLVFLPVGLIVLGLLIGMIRRFYYWVTGKPLPDADNAHEWEEDRPEF